MANQNILQLTQQTGSADTTSVLYAVKGGNTDTGLPLTVLFNSPHFTGTPLFNGAVALPITSGGTDATTAPQARAALGAASLANNTFSGSQSVSAASPFINLNDSSGTGTQTFILNSNGATQWQLQNTAANSFVVNRYVAGAFVDRPIVVANATGNVIFSAGVTAGSLTNTPISGSTGAFTTLIATGIIMPNQTAGIQGTNTNNNANAGSVGEHITATGSTVTLTTGVSTNITSISLTAGDWEVTGSIAFVSGAGTIFNSLNAGLSSTSATLPLSPLNSQLQATFSAGANQTLVAPSQRFLIASTTTVFLVANAGFTVATPVGTGTIRARRVR